MFVVGNKSDLYINEEIDKEKATNYAKSINAEYMCVSALKPSGIEELFETVGKKLLKREKFVQKEISIASITLLSKNDDKKKEKEKKRCCGKYIN